MKTEEIAQQLGAFPTLAEDQSWIPSTHVEKFKNACMCRSRGGGGGWGSITLVSADVCTDKHAPSPPTQLKLISINLET